MFGFAIPRSHLRDIRPEKLSQVNGKPLITSGVGMPSIPRSVTDSPDPKVESRAPSISRIVSLALPDFAHLCLLIRASDEETDYTHNSPRYRDVTADGIS
jgi:hypothetical protein